MKLRYRTYKGYYIPQYQIQNTTEWKDFTSKIVENTKLGTFMFLLNSYSDQSRTCSTDGIVIFQHEFTVMAFLGAASSYYKEEYKEFSL